MSVGSTIKTEASLNEAETFYKRGELDNCIGLCRSVLRGSPDNWRALQYLAQVAYVRKRYSQALSLVTRALSVAPEAPVLFNLRGAIYRALGELVESRSSFHNAVDLDPRFAAAHDNLGLVLRQMSDLAPALRSHKTAVALCPDRPEFKLHLGQALEAIGRADEALAQYRAALDLNTGLAEAYNGIGRIMQARGKTKTAVDSYRYAVNADPRLASAHCSLGIALSELRRFKESKRHLRQALRIDAGNPRALYSLGVVHASANEHLAAVRLLRKASNTAPDDHRVWFSLANNLAAVGRIAEASGAYQKARALQPDNQWVHSNYLFMLSANVLLPPDKMRRELPTWEANCGAPVQKRVKVRLPDDRRRNKRLRIGYVSPDFRHHVVRQFFEAVLAYHDRSRVEVHCYSEAPRQDRATITMRRLADYWTRTAGIPDEALAGRIRNDEIDILVDLAGHTANHRLGVFTYRPAPVQATYLGYFASTGISAMDYWITDWVLHPPDTEEPAVEKIFRLPRCAFGYGIPQDTPPRRHESGEGRALTFGYVNNLSKAGRSCIDAWSDILHGCPESRLVLRDRQFAEAEQRRRWRDCFARRGIYRERLEFHQGVRHSDYLRSLQSIDIALDPFPRTGGTTTADCLWMGVPVITLAGRRYVERISATKLTAVGLPELVAQTREDYVERAVRLALDPERLTSMKASLRDRMTRSPLCNTRDLTRALEAAYREMWCRFVSRLN